MSNFENRVKALEAAIRLYAANNSLAWNNYANDALNFLETGSFAPAAPAPVAADPTPASPVSVDPEKPARKPRTPAKPVENAAPVPAPAALPANTTLLPGVAQPAAPIAVAATPNKEPTLDDVRTALVQCQTRKGGKDVPQAILSKYSPNKTTGGLKKEDFVKVISECASA